MQNVAKRDRLSARWQRYQGLASVRDGSSLSMLECEKKFEPRCVCSLPAVMWEAEYFCVVTGDLSEKCSGAVASLGPRDK